MPSAYKELYTGLVWEGILKKYPFLDIIPKLAALSDEYPFYRRFTDANNVAAPLVRDAVQGKLSPKEALEQVEKQVNVALAT